MLDPPPWQVPSWPWSPRLQTLGDFQEQVGSSGAAPGPATLAALGRPAELLQALLALGGRNVAAADLIDALWPDAEGDAADRALRVNLHRLRRALGDATLVRMEHGRIGLDPSRGWWDV